MPEPVWRGLLRLSLVACPVRLAPSPAAVRRGRRIPGTGPGGAPEAAADDTANVIEIDHFSPRDQIEKARIETSYFLFTDADAAADTLEALRLAMARSDRDGLGYLRGGGIERMVLLQTYGGGLMLSVLGPPNPARRLASGEGEVARELVETADAIIGRHFLGVDPNTLHDRFEERRRPAAHHRAVHSRRASDRVAEPPPPPAPEGEPEAAQSAAAFQLTAIGRGAAAAPVAPEKAADGDERAPGAEPATASGEEAQADGIELVEAAVPAETAGAFSDADREIAEAQRQALERRPLSAEGKGRDVGAEVLLHIMGVGDRRFVERGWAGQPGGRRQIEAISIRPLDKIDPSGVEFRVFAQGGRATAWVSNGNYAGTRGRELPLTGFAVRPAAELRDRFDVVYEGCFFEGGMVGPKRNGEICTSPMPNDPLEAVRVSIVERTEATVVSLPRPD
jgi:hypothetical protein